MRLYLLRHGQTEWSRDGRHTSRTDVPLTAVGEEQAVAAADRIAGVEFDLVLVSPRLRARQTAELAGLGTDRIVDDLTEWDYGDYEGITTPEIHQRDPNWNLWTGHTPGGETPSQVRARCERVIADVEASGASRIVLVAHGHLLRSLALVWLGLDFALGERFPFATGALGVLGTNREERALLRWNS